MKTNEWKGERIKDVMEFMIFYQIIQIPNPTGGSRGRKEKVEEGGGGGYGAKPLTYFNFWKLKWKREEK